MLNTYADQYRRDLFDSVIPFWLRHSLDRECGGYFTCLERDGSVYDTKKYVWLQGRAVWMFARLYNEVERRQEYLDAAALGVEFLRRFGRDPQGRVYFSLTREGKPFFYQRKPYAAVFTMMGLTEFYRATGERSYLDEAIDLYWRIGEWVREPALMDRPALDGAPPTSGLANVMVLAGMTLELMRVHDDPRYLQVLHEAADGVVRHYDRERRVLVENVPLAGGSISDTPEGRLFSPGHSIEVAWFLLHLLEVLPNPDLRRLALDVIEGSLEFGWDTEFGGLYYFMDTAGKPTLQLESSMKLWWVHTEAIYALVLAYTLTREPRWLEWLEKVHAYAYRHFADPEPGEWFGYCDRRGNLALTAKGGNYKGFFHVPRALLSCIQRIEGSR